MKRFETNRLIIRRFLPEDWKDLYEYMQISEVVFYEPYETFTEEDSIEVAKMRSKDSENNAFWAVCLKETGKMIGNMYFAKQQPEEFMTWEIGYVFNPKFYGKGYATEASKEILRYAFEELNAHRVIAGVNIKNHKSWKLLERLSMRREGYMLENVFFKRKSDGQPIWHDSYKYGILSREWNKAE